MRPWQDSQRVCEWREACEQHRPASPAIAEPAPTPLPPRGPRLAGGDPVAIERIIELMRRRTGVDFAAYRRATIERRIGNRMIAAGIDALPAYVACLQSDPAEAGLLLERLTIKVSRFYRNAATFEHLASVVIPALAAARGDAPLRVWCAGCGRGEEAHTLAMLLQQAGVAGSVLATDVDERALQEAADGTYAESALDELPASLRGRWLEPLPGNGRQRYRVAPPIRQRVQLARHDLLAMPSPETGPFDLVSCRNVVIYFGPHGQQRAFRTLQAAIAADGFLCIGEAEWPDTELSARLAVSGYKTQIFRALSPAAGR